MPELDEMMRWFADNGALGQVASVSLLLLLAYGVYAVAYRVLVVGLRRLVRRSETQWDDALVDATVFGRLAHVLPALIIYYGVTFLPKLNETVEVLLQRVVFSVLIIVAVRAVSAFLSAANEIYLANPENLSRPIKGYLQVVKIFLFLMAGLLVIATLMDRSPLIFLSGIGAMTAVLLLVFRDTILSLVASVQLTGNDMIHVGDWIEVPKFGADGDVIDVALHTVSVQNWDKTITTIPTHALISDSFKNWRGMSQSGGRRIKRAIHIDVSSVHFLEPEEIERFRGWMLLRDYIAEKGGEIERHNRADGRDAAISGDIRRLTNIGTFRAYIERYLLAHPEIHRGMTLMVRQLATTESGLPIEVYCFTTTTNWNAYESIQADLFDHLFAIVPELGLRAFQSPAGSDLVALARSSGDTP
jgi:miniconductance mechanosensitive channel